MNRCKTCKHWTRMDDGDQPHAGHCDSPKFVYQAPLPVDGLEYWDYESYSAGFQTGEDFGCVHHTPHDGGGGPNG